MDMSDDEDSKRYDFVDYLATQYLEAVDEDSRAANKQAAARLKYLDLISFYHNMCLFSYHI